MGNKNAEARMADLFTDYYPLLTRNGLALLIKDNPKVAVQHVPSAIRPQTLHDRLTADLSFAKYDPRKDFQGFLAHAIKVAVAFQIIDEGYTPQNNDDSDQTGTLHGGRGRGRGCGGRGRFCGGGGGGDGGDDSGRKPAIKPLCLWEPHRRQGVRHMLRDCPNCPNEEKEALFAKLEEDKARTGPATRTRSQTTTQTPATTTPSGTKTTTGRLQHSVRPQTSPSCPITVYEGPTSHRGMGRCDDSSDESIVSADIAQEAVVNGIGRMTAIAPIKIQGALRESGEPATFTFSRTWHVPRLALHLSVGLMALLNVTFLVADGETASEDLLVGLLVLRHLGIDSRTLLEEKWSSLNETDCSTVADHARDGQTSRLGRLLLARLQRNVSIEPQEKTRMLDPDRPRSNFFDTQMDLDPFPDPYLLKPEDEQADAEAATVEITGMINRAKQNGFPSDKWDELQSLIWEHKEQFRTCFSSEAAKVTPLKINLTADAKPVHVKLRNYSSEQRTFMSTLVGDLRRLNFVYPNPTSKWASAPLIVAKPGPARWRFTVDLRPIILYTQRHHYPMPILEQ